jgi:hypothetical protein
VWEKQLKNKKWTNARVNCLKIPVLKHLYVVNLSRGHIIYYYLRDTRIVCKRHGNKLLCLAVR